MAQLRCTNVAFCCSGCTPFSVDGANGRLLEVTDDLSCSIFSANTIAGLPVIEAFANYCVSMGQFGGHKFEVTCTSIRGGKCSTASGTYSTVGGGCCNAATGGSSFIGGGYFNVASGNGSVAVGGRCSTASGVYSFVGGGAGSSIGGPGNLASGNCSFVGGGYQNCSICSATTVSGGYVNCATSNYATVSGGIFNTASGYSSIVGGGSLNIAGKFYSTVSGGYINCSTGNRSFIGGGGKNCAGNFFAGGGEHQAVVGGLCSCAFGDYSFVGGGQFNCAICNYTSIVGGICNRANNCNVHVIGSCMNGTTANYTYVNNLCQCGGGLSDCRAKQNIQPTGFGLKEITKLNPVSYCWKDEICNPKRYYGFTAQNIQEAMSCVVTCNSLFRLGLDGSRVLNGEEGEPLLEFEKDAVYASYANAFKELKAENDTLKQRITAIENILKNNNLL